VLVVMDPRPDQWLSGASWPASVSQSGSLRGSGRRCRRGNRLDVILYRLLPVQLHIVPAVVRPNQTRPRDSRAASDTRDARYQFPATVTGERRTLAASCRSRRARYLLPSATII